MEFWQVLVTSSVVAAVITVMVTRILKRFDDDALRSAIKQAIQAEIDYARDFALDYLKPGSVKSPMHRITTSFYDEGVPKLIILGAIDYERALALLQYYGNIDQMNRSLELAASLDGAEKLAEVARTIYKACSLSQFRIFVASSAIRARMRSTAFDAALYGEPALDVHVPHDPRSSIHFDDGAHNAGRRFFGPKHNTSVSAVAALDGRPQILRIYHSKHARTPLDAARIIVGTTNVRHFVKPNGRETGWREIFA